MQRSFSSLIQFFLSFPRLPIAIIIHFKQPLGRLMAAVFNNQPNRESQRRMFAAGGELCFLGIVRLAGQIEWISTNRAERLKRLKHLQRLKRE